ncbi:MAG: CmcJ/NvfI family oxidoreductase [Novosphingobium sp.]
MADVTTTRDNPESGAREAQALIRYLGEGDFVTRRYVSQGAEINTGEYSDHAMAVRDGMPIRDHFALDTHGFRIATCPTGVGDFDDAAEVDAKYAAEVAEAVKALTGASFVAVQGWMRRTSADLSQRAAQKVAGYQHSGGLQPQAGEAHIDYNPRTGEAAGKRVYAAERPDGPGYTRHCCFSFWRTYSLGPQDWPLAMMDGRSIQGDELASNTLFVVDEFPVGDALTAPVEGEDTMIAATILRHRPQHRWWYFSNMANDDALLFKFYYSDHSVTWRCPHTAFHDSSLPDTRTRSSIEVRCIAFWE